MSNKPGAGVSFVLTPSRLPVRRAWSAWSLPTPPIRACAAPRPSLSQSRGIKHKLGPAPITYSPVVFPCLTNHSAFAFRSPILPPVAFGFPIFARKQFVVTCKRCRRDVPSGLKVFPFQSIVVSCPLCGELRRYLPSEVFLGNVHTQVSKSVSNG